MSTLPSIERLSPGQLAALKSKIESRQAKQAASLADLQQLLNVASQNMQAIASVALAAGLSMPLTPQPQPAAPNGDKHAPVVKRAKRRMKHKVRKLTVKELLATETPATPHPTKGIKIGVKYRNPQNPAQEWTGRGKMPGWMRTTGLPKENFLVR